MFIFEHKLNKEGMFYIFNSFGFQVITHLGVSVCVRLSIQHVFLENERSFCTLLPIAHDWVSIGNLGGGRYFNCFNTFRTTMFRRDLILKLVVCLGSRG